MNFYQKDDLGSGFRSLWRQTDARWQRPM